MSALPPQLDPEVARSVLVDAGLFRQLVEICANGRTLRPFLSCAFEHHEVSKLPDIEQWLWRWTLPFHYENSALMMSPERLAEFQLELNAWKETILDMAKRRPEGARQTAMLLKKIQLEKGHRKYAAMTLCDLAARFKEAGMLRMQLEMACLAMVANPHDPQCHCQYGDALKSNRRFAEALCTYDDAAAEFPDDAVARNGKAEVLRDLSRLADALACYEETIDRHPDNAVARCGKAEVLRDLNRLADALACYEETIDRHPDNTVARNGKASILAKSGRIIEALELLPEAVPESVQAWRAYHMRGMILLKQGEIEMAKELFDVGCAANLPRKQGAYFRTGSALCHLQQREIAKALEVLPTAPGTELRHLVPLLRAHALGEQGETSACQRTLEPLLEWTRPGYQATAQEIGCRYVEKRPAHSLEWLFQEEMDLAMAA